MNCHRWRLLGGIAFDIACMAGRMGWRVRRAWSSDSGSRYMVLAFGERRCLLRVSDHQLPRRARVELRDTRGRGAFVNWVLPRHWGRSMAWLRFRLWEVAWS